MMYNNMDDQYENGMDLKEQLVIWKRAGYLLDNIALTPKLSEQLVDQGIFTLEMMRNIMVRMGWTEHVMNSLMTPTNLLIH